MVACIEIDNISLIYKWNTFWLTCMVVDTEGTQHLLLFWQWPQIFGRYNFRETHGPNRILDGPIRCIFRHSCPFCLPIPCCFVHGTWLSKFQHKINKPKSISCYIKSTILNYGCYRCNLHKSNMFFCHNIWLKFRNSEITVGTWQECD